MPYVPRISEYGCDISGPEANVNPATQVPFNTATFGQTYFAEDTGRTFICIGSGVWTPVSTYGLAQGAAGSITPVSKLLTAMADNTPVNLCLVTIPNAIMGAAIGFTVLGTLGDGDSSESSYWTAAFSRIAGANAKIAISAKGNNAATAGATANAAVTLSNTAVSGAVGAVNTFQMQIKVARSAGTSTNHVVVADIMLLNGFASGITVA